MTRNNDDAYAAKITPEMKNEAARKIARRRFGGVLALSWMAMAAGCVTVVPAPGAAQVRLTMNPVDVSGCTPLGNVAPLPNESASRAKALFRNRVVGLGGNAGLITQSIFGEPIEGIAYRCPAGANKAAGP